MRWSAMSAESVEAAAAQVDRLCWTGILLGLAFTMTNVQGFAAAQPAQQQDHPQPGDRQQERADVRGDGKLGNHQRCPLSSSFSSAVYRAKKRKRRAAGSGVRWACRAGAAEDGR